jgi:RHS repeat-associated protein
MKVISKILIGLFLLSSFSSFALQEQLSEILKGEQIKNGSLYIEQPYHNQSGGGALTESSLMLKLFHNDVEMIYYDDGWNLDVAYTLELTYVNGTVVTKTGTLSLDHAPYGSLDKNIDLAIYKGVSAATLTVTSVTFEDNNSATIISLADDFHLELLLETERYFNLSATANPEITSTNTLTATNELEIAWSYIEGAETYELEWLFVSDGDSLGANPPSSTIDYDFGNAARVRLSETHYPISLAYPKGYLIYRVRAIGHNTSLSQFLDSYVYTNWSYEPTTLTVNQAATDDGAAECYHYHVGTDIDKNWTHTVSYAEDGKRKEVSAYFDGSGRNRQSVTVINSDNNAVVAETKYDAAGRAMVNILPTPISSEGIKFYGDINTPFNGDWDYNDFALDVHLDESNLNGLPEALPSGAEASIYYSGSNPGVMYNKKTIPDANGYPYSLTQVSNDGLARPVISTGVGDELRYQAQGGHNTRYFYSVPTQPEVDRLFGNEAGKAEYYQKNIVIDPNGQQSVQYINAYGKTIATALAGVSPSNLDALASNNTDTITAEIFAAPKSRGASSRVQQRMDLMASSLDPITIGYDLDPDFLASCRQASNTTYNQFAYDVNFKVVNSRGLVVDSISYKYVNQLDTNPIVFNPSLQTYSITRTIQINAAAKANFLATEDSLVEYFRTDGGCGPQYIISGDTICDTLSCDSACLLSYSFYENGFLLYTDDNGNIYEPILGNPGVYTIRDSISPTYNMSDPQAPFNQAIAQCIVDCERAEDTTGGLDVLDFYTNDRCQIKLDRMEDDLGPNGRLTENCVTTYCYQIDTNSTIIHDGLIDSLVISSVIYTTGYAEGNVITTLYNVTVENGTFCVDTALGSILWAAKSDYLNINDQIVDLDHYAMLVSTSTDCTTDTTSGLLTNANLTQANTILGTAYASWSELYDNWDESYASLLLPLHPEYCAYNYFCNYSESCSGSGSLSIAEVNEYGGLMFLPQNASQAGYIGHPYDAARFYNFFNPTGITTTVSSNGISANNAGYFNESTGVWEKDPLLICGSTDTLTLSGYAAYYLDKYLSEFLPVADNLGDTNGHYSLWYVLDDPDGIADGHSGNHTGLHQDIIDLFNAYHGDGGCVNGFINSDFDKYVLFRSIYQFLREKVIYDYFDRVYTGCSGNTAYTYWDGDADYNGYHDVTNHALSFPKNPIFDFYSNQNAQSLIDQIGANAGDIQGVMDTTVTDTCSCNKFEAYLITKGLTAASDTAISTALYNDFCQVYGSNTVASFRACINGTSYGSLGLLPDSLKCGFDIYYNGGIQESCEENKRRLAHEEAEARWARIKAAYLDSLAAAYDDAAYEALNVNEKVSLTYTHGEYHYTLYYYDLAGNLIKTVPPQGVDILEDAEIATVKANRAAGNTTLLRPAHSYVTNYKYNSQNQLIEQNTPDGGLTRFWYDEVNRLVLSQNARQVDASIGMYKYSYTFYDGLGRIVEVGEVNPGGDTSIVDSVEKSSTAFYNAIESEARSEVVFTLYDRALKDVAGSTQSQQMIHDAFKFDGQKNLRNRVASALFVGDIAVNEGVYIFNNIQASSIPSDYLSYDHAYHYSYDEHGNVSKLLQEIPELGTYDRRFITLEYDYDLISGNVKEVAYQPGKAEQFFHRYNYDADNRITAVQTSRNGLLWDEDANYLYLPHGPLTRTELGDMHIQGIDYAYTLQGWLKMTNGASLAEGAVQGSLEIGRDGEEGKINHPFAPDVMAFQLDYFENDFEPIINDYYVPDMGSSNAITSATRDLYNGNIARMTTNFWDNSQEETDASINTYAYDQLNRITGFDAFKDDDFNKTGVVSSPSAMGYKTTYSYDANGNLLTLDRYNGNGTRFDQLSYTYDVAGTSGPLKNQLMFVNDGISNTTIESTDLENQTGATTTNPNYSYDASGNLIADNAENIDKISWTVSGKINTIEREGTVAKDNLYFGYDAMGNRYKKKSELNSTSTDQSSTYYSRDASGNVMAVYTVDHTAQTNELLVSELNIYGSDRLGTLSEGTVIPQAAGSIAETGDLNAGYSYGMRIEDTLAINGDTGSTASLFAEDGDLIILTNGGSVSFLMGEIEGVLVGEDTKYTLPQGSGITASLIGSIDLSSTGLFRIDPIDTISYSGTISNLDVSIQDASRTVGHKRYELKNHLGNVLSTVSDKKTWRSIDEETILIDESYATVDAIHGWSNYGSATFEPGKGEPTGGQVIYTDGEAGVTRTISNDVSCNYTLCFDLEYLSGAPLILTIEDSEGNPVFTDEDVNEAGQRYCYTTDGAELGGQFTVLLTNTDGVGEFIIDNFSLVKACPTYQQVADVISAQDYFPFGMIMPGRSYQGSEDYRYGYQGSEKDDGVSGSGNSYTTHFRQLDPRLGRWWSVDPKTELLPSESPYLSMGGNPVLYNDIRGDIWDVTTDDQTQKDVKSLVKTDNQKYINIGENGSVSLDFGDATPDEIQSLKDNDEGLNLISDLVSAEKKYHYSSTEVAPVKDGYGNLQFWSAKHDYNGVVNASKGGKDGFNRLTYTPRGDYDGQVAVSSEGSWEETHPHHKMPISLPRSNLIFHELAENYERTNNNVDYNGKGKISGAHKLAEDRQKVWISQDKGTRGFGTNPHGGYFPATTNQSKRDIVLPYYKMMESLKYLKLY